MLEIMKDMKVGDYFEYIREKIETKDYEYLNEVIKITLKEIKVLKKDSTTEKINLLIVKLYYSVLTNLFKNENNIELKEDYTNLKEMLELERVTLDEVKIIYKVHKKEKYYERMDDVYLLYLCLIEYRNCRLKIKDAIERKEECYLKFLNFVISLEDEKKALLEAKENMKVISDSFFEDEEDTKKRKN